jgi:hypothetical protein
MQVDKPGADRRDRTASGEPLQDAGEEQDIEPACRGESTITPACATSAAVSTGRRPTWSDRAPSTSSDTRTATAIRRKQQ